MVRRLGDGEDFDLEIGMTSRLREGHADGMGDAFGGEVGGVDQGNEAGAAESAESEVADGARGLGGEPTAPEPWGQEVGKLDLRDAFAEWCEGRRWVVGGPAFFLSFSRRVATVRECHPIS